MAMGTPGAPDGDVLWCQAEWRVIYVSYYFEETQEAGHITACLRHLLQDYPILAGLQLCPPLLISLPRSTHLPLLPATHVSHMHAYQSLPILTYHLHKPVLPSSVVLQSLFCQISFVLPIANVPRSFARFKLGSHQPQPSTPLA